jgi:hypothetical protein
MLQRSKSRIPRLKPGDSELNVAYQRLNEQDSHIRQTQAWGQGQLVDVDIVTVPVVHTNMTNVSYNAVSKSFVQSNMRPIPTPPGHPRSEPACAA